MNDDTEFRFTRDLLTWLHRHAENHTVEALARGCGCSSASTIANICRRHGIAPSKADITGDDPPAFRPIVQAPKLVPGDVDKARLRPALAQILEE